LPSYNFGHFGRLRIARRLLFAMFIAGYVAALSSVQTPSAQQAQPVVANSAAPASHGAVFSRYCVTCHNQRLKTAGLALDTFDAANPTANPEVWEKVIAKLRAGSMPPPGMPRPDVSTYRTIAGWLESELDRAWAANPNPGRSGAVHRLNRTEYNNAVRDLLALDFDVKPLLPGDETADGSFDNYADALTISTAHLERYLSVARQVSRQATGLPPSAPGLATYPIPLHIVQDDRQSEDLPFGSRGGIAIHHNFPVSGDYTIRVRLRRQYQDYIMGMGWAQQLDVRLDDKLLKRFRVGGEAPGRPAAASYAGDGEPGFAGAPEWEEYMLIKGDAGLELRVPVEAGPRVLGVTFVRELFEPEGLPQPLQRGRVLTNDQVYMDYAAVGQVQISGPYDPAPVAKDTPSRRAIFICEPSGAAGSTRADESERACATKILSRIARLAYRRPTTPADIKTLLEFFATGRREGGSFDTGIQFALERVLVDPDFLLRVYRDPVETRSAGGGQDQRRAPHRLSDLEVASRLSFFLWASIPDEGLLDLAERGELTKPEVLDQQVRRMLADPRAVDALVDDFAAQWLNLRRVGEVVAHPDLYPSFDDSLLEAFQTETEMFVASTLREDRSVHDLLRADYTFVNERLARHYGIPNVYGSRFRRVTLPNLEQRGGLLANGSLLATTSYPDRTSPVLRGKWLLNNIFGLPIPPPPPGVDTNLVETKPGAVPPTIRERLAQHRKDPVCNSCHSSIDPMGFALENFDAIGAWRSVDEGGRPVDTDGITPGGVKIGGLVGLRAALLDEPEQFPRTVTEKLLAYALGRPLSYYDRPTVRSVVRDAAAQDYKWSALIVGIVKSPTFLMRSSATVVN
jgi:mono/diheme cytochrome c family protein